MHLMMVKKMAFNAFKREVFSLLKNTSKITNSTLAQVKAGNVSENILDEFCQTINSLCQGK